MTQSSRGHVVIVGGGVIGTSCAWYLSKVGWRVTVIDRGKMGHGCSHGNCGLVCPSHLLPLAEPGAIRDALRAMVKSNSALRVRPGLNLALWSWLWNFARRCNYRSMLEAGHAIQALLGSSMSEYEQLMSVERLDCEWEKKGLLFAYLNRTRLDGFGETNKLLTEVYDEPARKLDTEEVCELEPALKSNVAGGWYYEHDAHLRPDRLLESLRNKLLVQGVEFLEQCELQRVIGTGGTIQSVDTSTGKLAADVFVMAAGAWTPRLREHLGCHIPIQPGKGYSITMPRPAVCPSIPLIFPEHRVAVTPMKSAYRLGSIMELVGYDASIRPERLNLLRDGAALYLREPYCTPELSSWYGWRPMTFDSLPIIDRSSKWGNLWIAAGHNMLGVSMAPGTGKLVSELVTGRSPHIDPAPYRISRFS